MRLYGLVGYPLSHSFSPAYFKKKFEQESILDAEYRLFPIEHISLINELYELPNLCGLNVTIPYKEKIIPYLDQLDPIAETIGAVNTIHIFDGKKIGYNTDIIGFKKALQSLIGNERPNALILGTGGAAKAIYYCLATMGIDSSFVSRKSAPLARSISYNEVDKKCLEHHRLIINTTPLGTYPEVDDYPSIDVDLLNENHFLYDLIYNPKETMLMRLAQAKGAKVSNGYNMLIGQAEASWSIWNKQSP